MGGKREQKKKGHGKGAAVFLLAAVCVLGGWYASARLDLQLPDLTPTDGTGDSSPAPEQESHTFRGTISDSMMSTLLVTAADGSTYAFDKSQIKMTTGETGSRIGNSVTVTYIEAQDPQKPESTVSIIVEDPPEADPSESPDVTPTDSTAVATPESILDNMTLEEKVGQMFIARCPEADAAQKAADYHLGGYILFGRDFEGKNKTQVIQTIQSYQDEAKIPLLIGVDEEGGSVNRVSRNPELRAVPFWSPQDLYAEGGFDLIRSDTEEKCELLKSLGINLNFAPVCDVSTDPSDFMYSRAFGKDAAQTAQYVETVVEVMQAEGVGSVLKHFPGYGNNADTHTGIAYDHRSYETFLTSDFIPFQAGIDAGADMVLVSHSIVECMDDEKPASLSPHVHEILRDELGFSGVIVTDDLAMEGVRDFAGDEEIAVLAIQAGNDLLCCTNFEEQIPAVVAAVQQGDIPEEQIDASVLRILQLKQALGMVL